MVFYFIFTTAINLSLGFAAAIFLMRQRQSSERALASGSLLVESPLVLSSAPTVKTIELAPRAHDIELEERPIVQWPAEPAKPVLEHAH